MFLRMFSRKWLLTTILVIAAMAVMARLGKWQLDRLAQRRAFNARVEAQINSEPLNLTGSALQEDLVDMEYRKTTVQGEYDFKDQIALRNQAMNGQWGVDLVTPLRIAGSDRAILVDRGWIPADDYTDGDWSKYDEPREATVTGVFRQSQNKADLGFRRDPTPAPGQGPLKSWYFVNIAEIGKQVPYPLLPVYIQQAPDPAWTGLPNRTQPELNLSEGPHLGYAIQWFAFAILLGGGYPFFIRRRETTPDEPKEDRLGQASRVGHGTGVR
jgi:surfeit locus 1 family protein